MRCCAEFRFPSQTKPRSFADSEETKTETHSVERPNDFPFADVGVLRDTVSQLWHAGRGTDEHVLKSVFLNGLRHSRGRLSCLRNKALR